MARGTPGVPRHCRMETCHYWTQTFPGITLTLVERGGELVVCAFGGDIKYIKSYLRQHLPKAHLVRKREPLQPMIAQLREYFAGDRKQFQIPVTLFGTVFQMRVWNALRRIKYGETLTYGDLAAQLGDPHLARAVGAACGANPVAIVVPCHRIVGAGDKLTGYGGGIETKRRLLQLEGSVLI